MSLDSYIQRVPCASSMRRHGTFTLPPPASSRALFGIALGVVQRDGHVQPAHGAPRLDAERAGVELIQRQLGRFGVDLGLALRRALLRARPGQASPSRMI